MSSRSESKSRSGLARFWLALAGTLVVLTGATLALPHDPYIRYQSLNDTIYNRAQWIYERIHFDETSIDVVLIGSSRTAAAANPVLIEEALAARGAPLRVVNFSLPSSGFDIRDTILRDTFAAKSPKLIVVSVVEAFPRDGHDAWGEIAPVGEVLGAPLIVNRNWPGNLLRLPVRQISLAAATLVPEAFSRQSTFDPDMYAGSTIDQRTAMGFDEDLDKLTTPEHAERLERQANRRKRSITPPILPESLSWIEFGVSQSYLDEITDLAAANGAEVAFLFLPFYTGPEGPIEAEWLAARAPLWAANFVQGTPENYVDSGHLANVPALRSAVADWLAENITAALEQKE